MMSFPLGLLDIIQNIKIVWNKRTMLKMPFKNSLLISLLSPVKFAEIKVNSKYFFFLLSGKYVLEKCILFSHEAEMHVQKNSESDNKSLDAITKTRLYNFDPLKPHFYIVKLEFTWVYIIFLISAKNIDCGYSLELPRRGSYNGYPQSVFWEKYEKNIRIFIWKFSFFGGKIFSIFE